MKRILSAREIEVLELIAKGCKNLEIALVLELQEVTIRFRIGKILKKLDAKNRTEAACYAIKNGLIQDR